MLQEVAKRVEGLDVNKSAFLPQYSFVTDKGDSKLCQAPLFFVQEINKEFGELLDIKGCKIAGAGGACIMSFLDVKPVEEVKEETPVESSSEVIVDVSFDLEYAESLEEGKSKKEAKNALERYGRTLNVELNKQKTFANMLKELQKEISSQQQ